MPRLHRRATYSITDDQKIGNIADLEAIVRSVADGEALHEGELAKRYGVTKSPVRDAIQILEFDGPTAMNPAVASA